jgi:hypothetical protein
MKSQGKCHTTPLRQGQLQKSYIPWFKHTCRGSRKRLDGDTSIINIRTTVSCDLPNGPKKGQNKIPRAIEDVMFYISGMHEWLCNECVIGWLRLSHSEELTHCEPKGIVLIIPMVRFGDQHEAYTQITVFWCAYTALVLSGIITADSEVEFWYRHWIHKQKQKTNSPTVELLRLLRSRVHQVCLDNIIIMHSACGGAQGWFPRLILFCKR